MKPIITDTSVVPFTSSMVSSLSSSFPARIASLALALSLTLLAGSGKGQAATLSYNAALPTGSDVFLTSATTGSGGTTIQDSSSAHRSAGFSFMVDTTETLDKVSFLVGASWNSSILGKQLKIDVVTLTSLSATPDYSTPSTIIASETATLPSTSSFATTSPFYLTFDLATSLTLNPNQAYGIVVSFVDTASNTNGMSLRFSTVKGGTAIGYGYYTDDAGTTYTGSQYAYVFALESVPEPKISALLFLASGVILGGVAMSRRNRNQHR